MIDLAHKAFLERVKLAFPEVTATYLNWQGSHIKVQYPYMVIVTVSSKLQSFIPSVAEKINDQSSIMNTGQWETRINIHYLSEQGKINNQSSVLQRFVDFMQGDLISGSKASASLVVPFGDENYKKCNISLLGWDLQQNSGSIRKGDRRIIFELLMDVPRLVKVDVPIIKDIIQNTEVSEYA